MKYGKYVLIVQTGETAGKISIIPKIAQSFICDNFKMFERISQLPIIEKTGFHAEILYCQ